MIKRERTRKLNRPLSAKNVEGFLWLLVIILVCMHQRGPSWLQYLTIFQYLCELFLESSHHPSFGDNVWRPSEDQGELMNIVLLPCLLQSAAFHDDAIYILAKCITILPISNRRLSFLSLIMIGIMDDTSGSIKPLLFFLIWNLCEQYFLRHHYGVLTRGEFGILNSISAIVMFEWIQNIFHSSQSGQHFSHSFIALSGIWGCGLTCSFLIYSKFPWWLRLPCHISGPLILVEASLWWKGYGKELYPQAPKTLNWLLLFLSSQENGYPRYWGLLYWAMILGMSLIPTQMVLETRTFSVVIRRKWFHLLATLLFGPVTLLMPQLMSLGYAVALCGLAVIENLRSDMLFLQSFYINFLDPSKDNPLLPVVSHIFLILGCAIPLWIAECDLIEFQQQKVLAQWGVLCLGVGDAAGAVIGSWYGKYRWGQNQRTMEGSLAMWISIFGISFMMFPKQNLLVLIISTTLTSLVEAFTSQMDNMVLPLVGSISFLVLT